MNIVCLTGRLTADPVVMATKEGTKVAKYRLAVSRSRRRGATDPNQPDADFVTCTTFGRVADFAETYLKKGMKIGVTGRLQTGSYEKDGIRRYTAEVIVQSHEFLEAKRNTASAAPAPAPEEDISHYVLADDDDDEKLPF